MKKWLVGLLAAGLCVASAWAATDTLNLAFTGVSGTSYTEWSEKEGDSGAIYAGQSAGDKESIQLRSNNNNSGIVTTGSGGTATKVTVVWNAETADARTLDIYGKNEAYTAPTDLYSKEAQGTKLGSLNKGNGDTELTIEGEYTFIGLRSNSGAMYLTSVEIEWDGEPTPVEFSIALKPDEDFEVVQGKSATITATVKGAQGDVTYSWSVNGSPINLAGNVYMVDSAEVGGPYEIACEASDGVSDPVSASVKYSVVEAPVVSGDVLTRETTGVEGTSYADWTATGDSGTKYSGNSAGGNDSIQLRTTNKNSGLVITESAGSDVTSVTVEWNDATAEGRTIQIYGRADAYTSAADLHGDNKGTLLGELAKGETTLEVPEGYAYIGIRSKDGALYLTSVAIDFAGGSSMLSLSFDPASPLTLDEGVAGSVTAIGKGGEAPYTFAWECEDVPELNGTGEKLDIPATLEIGTYTVQATVTDNAGIEVPKPFVIIVKAPSVPHTISVTVEGNGTAEADVSEAKAGELVTLTVTPGEGSKVGSIMVNGTAITGTSFEMLDEDVAVVVAFVEKPVLSGDVLTRETTGVTGTSYKDWTATGDSGAEYAGNSAGGNDSIQMRTTNPSGIVITKSSGKDVASVTVEWNDATAAEKRSLEIYGSTEAYAGPVALYEASTKGELLGTIARDGATLEIPAGYPYVGVLAKGGAVYLTSVAFDFGGAAAFSISLNPAEDFEVQQGKDAAITATVRGAQGDVSYSWSVNGNPINLSGNVYAIDTTEVGGPYEVVCEASDGVSEPVSASVSYTVVEVPPVTGDEFALITSVDDLVDGAEYVITDNTKAYAMKAELSSGSTRRLLNEAVEPVDDVITTEDESIIWQLVQSSDGTFAFYNESIGKYIGWTSGNSAKFQDDAFANTISYEEGLFVVLATSTAELEKPRKLQFNSASNSLQFAYYEGTQKNLNFFKKAGAAKPKLSGPDSLEGQAGVQLTATFEVKNLGELTVTKWEADYGTITSEGVWSMTATEATRFTMEVKATLSDDTVLTKEVAVTFEDAGTDPFLTCAEGTTIAATVGKELVLHFTLANAEFYTGDGAETLIGDGQGLGVISDVTATSFVWKYTPAAAGTVNLDFNACDENYDPIIESYPVTLNVSEGGGGSQFKITNMTITGGAIVLTFEGDGATAVVGTTSLVEPNWQDVQGAAISGNSATVPMEGQQLFIGLR